MIGEPVEPSGGLTGPPGRDAEFFTVKRHVEPALDPDAYRLEVTGLVERPARHSLAALRARPRRTVEYTLECSGNTGLPFFIGGIGNAR